MGGFRYSDDGSQFQTIELPATSSADALAELWMAGKLCDVILRTSRDGNEVACHRVVLASWSGYFRALFSGAGALMSEGGSPVMQLGELDGHDLHAALQAMYSLKVQVDPSNLERLLCTASYLEMPALLEACCQYMRSNLSLHTCVPLLVLASRYSLLQLRAELLTYICAKFSSLVSSMPADVLGAGMLIPGAVAADAGSCSSQVGSSSRASSMDLVLTGPGGSSPVECSAVWPSGHSPSASVGAWQQHRDRQPRGMGQAAGSNDGDSNNSNNCNTHNINISKCHDSDSSSSNNNNNNNSNNFDNDSDNSPSSLNPLVGLSKDLLLEVLCSDELTVDCESNVLQVVLDWVACCPSSRRQDLPELLGTVRAAQLPQHLSLFCPTAAHHEAMQQLAFLLAAQLPRVHGSLEQDTSQRPHLPHVLHWQQVNQQYQEQQQQQQQQRVSVEPASLSSSRSSATGNTGHDQAAATPAASCSYDWGAPDVSLDPGQLPGAWCLGRGRARRHKASHLLAVGGYDASWRSLRSAEVYDPLQDCWSPGPALATGVSFAGCATLKREAFLVGGTPLCSQVARLSPGGCWEACPNLSQQRAHAGVVSAAGCLFVLGGRSQVQAVQQVLCSVQTYQPGKPAWESLPDMGLPRSALACAALAGWVYAIGGQTGKATQRSVEVFDTSSEQWLQLAASMGTERKYTAAGVLAGRLYVVGGVNEQRTKLATVEAMDPREGRWQVVAHMAAPRSSCGTAALHDRLYVVGGQAGDSDVHDLVECLEPAMNLFRPCARLGVGRSGLGLCAL